MIKIFLKISKNDFVQNVKNVFYDGKMYPFRTLALEEIKLILVHLQFFARYFCQIANKQLMSRMMCSEKNSEHYEEIWTATNAVGCSVFFFSFSIFFFCSIIFLLHYYFQKCILYILAKHKVSFFKFTKTFKRIIFLNESTIRELVPFFVP